MKEYEIAQGFKNNKNINGNDLEVSKYIEQVFQENNLNFTEEMLKSVRINTNPF